MSAESGVPTFRDVDTGLWANVDPYEMSSDDGWRRHPEKVWAWYLWRYHLISATEPNAGHYAVADWQQHHDVEIVTQNVDNLHERAGSKDVYHVHGSLFTFRCSACQSAYTGEIQAMPEPQAAIYPPTCECRGLVRPDIVWFGEQLPEDAWQSSVEAVLGADVLLVVGTSGVVYPAAGLPELALRNGIPVIEVNPQATPLTPHVTASIQAPSAEVLPGLLSRIDHLIT